MRRTRRGRQGQALVEVALVAPFLLLLFGGIAQIGTIVAAQIEVDTAAREGARVAASQPNDSQAYVHGAPQAAVTCPGNGANPVCNAVQHAAGNLTISSTNITIEPAKPASDNYATCSNTLPLNTYVAEGYVRVTVKYSVPVFVPLAGSIFSGGGGSTRQVSATVIERTDTCGIVEFTDIP